MSKRATPSVAVQSAARGMVKVAGQMLGLRTRIRIRWHRPEGRDWRGRVWGTSAKTIELVVGQSPRRTARTVAHELRHTHDLLTGKIPKMGPVHPDGKAEKRARRFARRALRQWDRFYRRNGTRRWFPLEDPPREGAQTA